MTRPLGFTGSQNGLTPAQDSALMSLIVALKPTSLHQGCCVGADHQVTAFFAFYVRLREKGGDRPRIIGYPSNIVAKTSLPAITLCDEVRPAKPPLERNRDIVNDSRKLIACPRLASEELRSGTWATIRFARKLKRHIYLLLPNGEVVEENVPVALGEKKSARVVDVRGLRGDARRGVVYVGRKFAGWSAHDLCNPFKPQPVGAGGACVNTTEARRDTYLVTCLDKYRDHLAKRPTLEADLAKLWEECRHGELPLGCWCGDWTPPQPPIQCHACILATMLNERFSSPNETGGGA